MYNERMGTMRKQYLWNEEIYRICDAAEKKILSSRELLARILHEVVPEFKNVSVEQIKNECFVEDPQTGETPVDDETPSAELRGSRTEDVSAREGTIRYDILFTARVPNTEQEILLMINVEAQNRTRTEYPILKRAVYYCSRLISSQHGTVFENSHYEKIRKVYSIWICPRPQKDRRNTLTIYQIQKRDILGNVREPQENYDLINIVMIGLDSPETIGRSGTINGLLSLFMSPGKLSNLERREMLQNKYDYKFRNGKEDPMDAIIDIPVMYYEAGIEEGIEKGIEQGIKKGIEQGIERGIERGIEQGIEQGTVNARMKFVFNLINDYNFSVEDAIRASGADTEERNVLLLEVERLLGNER